MQEIGLHQCYSHGLRFSYKTKKMFVVFFCLITFCLASILLPSNYISSYFIYFLFFLVSFIMLTLSEGLLKKWKILVVPFFIFVLSFCMGFRNKTGIDDWVYEQIFHQSSSMDLLSFVFSREEEIGFLLLTKILNIFTFDNFFLFQVILTYISFSLWYIGINSFSKKTVTTSWFYLFLISHYYFLVMSAGLMRIFIAIPLVLIALSFFAKKKYLLSAIYIFIAFLFHRSAIIMFFVFFYKKSTTIKDYFIRTIILMLLVPIVFITISQFIVPLLGNRYSGYSNIGKISFSIKDLDLLPILIIGLLFFKYIPKEYKTTYLLGMSLIGLSMAFSFWNSFVSFGRLSLYSNLGILFVCGGILGTKNKNNKGLCLSLILILYSCVYLFGTAFFNANQSIYLFPIKFLWQ